MQTSAIEADCRRHAERDAGQETARRCRTIIAIGIAAEANIMSRTGPN